MRKIPLYMDHMTFHRDGTLYSIRIGKREYIIRHYWKSERKSQIKAGESDSIEDCEYCNKIGWSADDYVPCPVHDEPERKPPPAQTEGEG